MNTVSRHLADDLESSTPDVQAARFLGRCPYLRPIAIRENAMWLGCRPLAAGAPPGLPYERARDSALARTLS